MKTKFSLWVKIFHCYLRLLNKHPLYILAFIPQFKPPVEHPRCSGTHTKHQMKRSNTTRWAVSQSKPARLTRVKQGLQLLNLSPRSFFHKNLIFTYKFWLFMKLCGSNSLVHVFSAKQLSIQNCVGKQTPKNRIVLANPVQMSFIWLHIISSKCLFVPYDICYFYLTRFIMVLPSTPAIHFQILHWEILPDVPGTLPNYTVCWVSRQKCFPGRAAVRKRGTDKPGSHVDVCFL